MAASSRLILDDIRAVFRLLGDVRDLRHDRAAWQRRAAEGLCEMLGARQAATLWMRGFHPAARVLHVDAVETGGHFHPTALGVWQSAIRSPQTVARDPVFVRTKARPERVIGLSRAEVIPDDEHYATPIVRELDQLWEIGACAIGWRRPPAGEGTVADAHALGVTLHRQRGERDFSARQRAVLRLFFEEFDVLAREGVFAPASPPGVHLSPRERQVVERLAAGDSVKQVALHLGLSHRTVEGYVKALHRKFGVSSRGELLGRFLRTGGR